MVGRCGLRTVAGRAGVDRKTARSTSLNNASRMRLVSICSCTWACGLAEHMHLHWGVGHESFIWRLMRSLTDWVADGLEDLGVHVCSSGCPELKQQSCPGGVEELCC